MYLAICSLFPILASMAMWFLRFKKRLYKMIYVETVTVITSASVFIALFSKNQATYELFRISDSFVLSFGMDGASSVFIGLAALLWPFASLYAFEYMHHEKREGKFFVFYTLAYGVTILLSAANNLFTMYVFYECLTLVTIPLVEHGQNKESFRAARTYMIYLIGGASLGFAALVMVNAHHADPFTLGGIMHEGAREILTLRLSFAFAFFGFAAKAAVFPLCRWLPKASVAPTPVTALLHAVAVVNAGVYAVLRITYYVYGPSFMYGTYIQSILLVLTAFTVAYGAIRAVRETHFKRRLAWSTVSNLSYMLSALMLMTAGGMAAALTHMVFHGLIKIVLFFTAGAVLVCTGKTHVRELHGLAKHMPVTFTSFLIAGLALTGLPPLCGFFSKYMLIDEMLAFGSWQGIMCACALIVSAICTAVYIFSVAVPAYFSVPEHDLEGNYDPHLPMKFVLIALTGVIIVVSLNSGRIMDAMRMIAGA
ncbi:MAG: proton-conducting membrane transporter [Clostridia bacterium]|nr:proton-conducting membrane transporter [Clostridia bacterium]